MAGNCVGVDHGQGLTSVFMHLSAVGVTEGQELQAGDTVGRVGTTGRSTGPHLHWGLYVHGKAVDPMQWVKPADPREASARHCLPVWAF